jgi:hypothetical protein
LGDGGVAVAGLEVLDGERVARVGVVGLELDGALVRGDGFARLLQLVVGVAEVEVGVRVRVV